MSEKGQIYGQIITTGPGEINMQHDNIKITAYGPGKTVIELDNDEGTFVDIEGTNEVPEIFTQEQFDYLSTLTGHTILRDLKGELLNIIEGCGLPEKQERAIKRSVTSALHEWHHSFKEDIELVTIKEIDGTKKYNTGHETIAVTCRDCNREYNVAPGAEYPKCHGKYMSKGNARSIDAKILDATIAPAKIKAITLE